MIVGEGVGSYQSVRCSQVRGEQRHRGDPHDEEPAKMSDYSRINTVRQIKPHTVMKRSARVSLRAMRGDALRNV